MSTPSRCRRPIASRADVAERPKRSAPAIGAAGPAHRGDDLVAAHDAARGTSPADEAGRPGHQDARQALPPPSDRPRNLSLRAMRSKARADTRSSSDRDCLVARCAPRDDATVLPRKPSEIAASRLHWWPRRLERGRSCSFWSPRIGISGRTGCRWRARRAMPGSRSSSRRGCATMASGSAARGSACAAGLAPARRRALRRRPGDRRDRRAVPPRAAGYRASCRAEAGAVRRPWPCGWHFRRRGCRRRSIP